MSFLIDDALLRRLAEVNSFPVPENEMVFFGLRGALQMLTRYYRVGELKKSKAARLAGDHPVERRTKDRAG